MKFHIIPTSNYLLWISRLGLLKLIVKNINSMVLIIKIIFYLCKPFVEMLLDNNQYYRICQQYNN